ncbi:MAG: glycoside hydrolase family 30 protein [Luteolibacter sp.]
MIAKTTNPPIPASGSLRRVLCLASLAVTSVSAQKVEIFQTTRKGDRLAAVAPSTAAGASDYSLTLDPSVSHQTLIGIGGAMTESSAQALSELSKKQSEAVLRAYFSKEGSRFSLTRTHIGSCDFSVTNYSYDPVPGDVKLEQFSIEPDRKYLLPMIKQAQAVPGADFKILASPWTAPPWMKTSGKWNGGSLKPEHYQTFSDYIARYIADYKKEGVPIWGITPENEPLGNGGQWESMEFTAAQMRDFIGQNLGPTLATAAPGTTIWAYDQNRDKNLVEWADTILADKKAASYVTGLAVHWYQSTRDIGPEIVASVSKAHPEKPMLHTEGCIDAMGDDEPIGSRLEDDWYWRQDSTDWGYVWAPAEDRKDHPKYRPFYRYAGDLIGGFNAGFVGWIDWNMVLDTRGGPNHARNFCGAPVLVDAGHDRVFYTPLFYAISHFSKFIRPGAQRIGLTGANADLVATAFRNPDGSVVAVAFNLLESDKTYTIRFGGLPETRISIPGQALQTVVIPAK